MADEQVVEQEPESTQPAETAATVDMAEFRKMADALKQANREAADRRKKLEAFERAENERKAAEMTELEKANMKLKEYESALNQTRREMLISKIALEAGLPPSLAERLQGNTEEEIRADADKLKELVKTSIKPPAISATNPGNAQRAESPAEKRERLLGSKTDVFSKGGGINWPDNQ